MAASLNLMSSYGGVSLKPLSTTRWTARTAAIDAILKDYSVLMETIHATTHNEYGLKASRCLHSLEQFNTLFGLRLAHILFGATEEVSMLLQRKDIAIQEELSGVDTAGIPTRFQGAAPYEYPSPRDYYCHVYSCDLLIGELGDRFESQHIPTVLSIE